MVTCGDAVREAVTELDDIVTTKQVIDFIYKKYPEKPWKKVSIRCHLIGLSFNHPSSKYYPTQRRRACLFSLGRGKFRLYDPEKDGKWIVTKKGVHLADEEPEEYIEEGEMVEASMSFERDLEEYIIRDLNQVEDGLKLYKTEGISGQQFPVDFGRIDILALNKNKDFVVIELKAGTATYRVVGQILSYISWVKKNIANGKKVRGVIIANEFDERLVYAISELPDIVLKKYNVKFEFQNVNTDFRKGEKKK